MPTCIVRGARRLGFSLQARCLAFVNAAFMGAGAKVWNPIALWAGLFTAALIIPVFLFRHYVQDKGVFPEHMLEDLGLTQADFNRRKAGSLPIHRARCGPRRRPDFKLVLPAAGLGERCCGPEQLFLLLRFAFTASGGFATLGAKRTEPAHRPRNCR